MLKINYNKNKYLGNKVKMQGKLTDIFEELCVIMFDNFLPRVKEESEDLANEFYNIIKRVIKEDTSNGGKKKNREKQQ